MSNAITMFALTTTGWWVAGSVAGVAAVIVAAALVLTVIALARRIVVQAREIEAALVAARDNTAPLFDIAMMNHALESITRGVKRAREQGDDDTDDDGTDDPGLLARIASGVAAWRPA